MNIFIAGLGLIGGSFARAVKEHTDHTVYGYDINADVCKRALSSDAIDFIAEQKDIQHADLTIVALYPARAAGFITQNAENFKPGSVVMDACGIKRKLYSELKSTIENAQFSFIGAHPMAGREFSGFDYSTGDLFNGASLIITPGSCDPSAVETVKALAADIGFSDCKISDPETHDRMIAYTSQLAHILACSYIDTPLSENHRGYSAGSFQDVTRVAYINDEMWAELFVDNRDMLVEQIQHLTDNLNEFKLALENADEDKLRLMMAHSRELKERI